MIDRLKEIAAKDNIQIIHGSLPENETMVYINRYDVKIIIINKNIRGIAREESEAIALGLGYSRAMEELGIKVNKFNKANNEDYKVATELAEEYQIKILHQLNLELISEVIKGKTDEEIEVLIEDMVEFMIKNKMIKKTDSND